MSSGWALIHLLGNKDFFRTLSVYMETGSTLPNPKSDLTKTSDISAQSDTGFSVGQKWFLLLHAVLTNASVQVYASVLACLFCPHQQGNTVFPFEPRINLY